MTIALKADPSGSFGSILINGTEAVRVNANGIPASSMAFTPSGNIAATNVQAAIQELDTETQVGLATKLSTSGGTMTGQINGITPTVAANLTRKDYVDSAVASDVNLKHSIGDFSDALFKINRLRGVSFIWNSDVAAGHLAGRASCGVIAQEAVAIIPEAVKDVGGILIIENHSLVGYLIEAVKELTAKVAELEAKCASL